MVLSKIRDSAAFDDPSISYAGHGTVEVNLTVNLPTIAHAGELASLSCLPAYLANDHMVSQNTPTHISCCYCGVGDSSKLFDTPVQKNVSETEPTTSYNNDLNIENIGPTESCIKFRYSTMTKPVAYPIHVAPSILDKHTGLRKSISYEEAIKVLAEQLLKHRIRNRRTLVYAAGQIDYFAIFAMQDVFRPLGIRNITGNAEHCLNAGAVHNELLTGQEGPFLTIEQIMTGSNHVFIFNGWNGCITHPPIYNQLCQKPDLDAFLFDVMETETVLGLSEIFGEQQISMIRSRSDGHIALAVAHEIFVNYPEAIEIRFIEQYANMHSFQSFRTCAVSTQYSPKNVSKRCAAEPKYQNKLLLTIQLLAKKLIDPKTVPVVIPSVGLSQTSGVVAHCLWGNLLAMLGKYGISPDSSALGGILRLPGQINAESEVQGLNRNYFMGRIPMSNAGEAAQRMGLPINAYDKLLQDMPRAALDYSDPTSEDELFLFFGTQFEANMPNRKRWLKKLQSSSNSIIVIDPIPDPWTLKHADLIIPSPPHSATSKLYQNGEWRLTISMPQKKASTQTRSDATIIYDAMAEITRQLMNDQTLLQQHRDIAGLFESGYLQQRFCPPVAMGDKGLTRLDGEVSRVELWHRIQEYLHWNDKPLYCSFDHADGTPITWQELIQAGNIVYGGVGINRFVINYENTNHRPFRNIYREPGEFRFFNPTLQDLEIPDGIILNSGRSSLSDDLNRIQYATGTFNSGKATPIDLIPEEHPLYVSHKLANILQLKTGDWAKVSSTTTGYYVIMPVVVSSRVKGNCLYTSFHRANSRDNRGFYINDIVDHKKRCPYTSQASLKIAQVNLQRLPNARYEDYDYICQNRIPAKFNLPQINVDQNIPVWNGKEREFVILDIIQETKNCFTFRLMGEPICYFSYKPGQYCSVIVNIANKRIVRSYTISSTPSRPYILEITVKRVQDGLVSNWMPDNLIVGDKIRIRTTEGDFYLKQNRPNNKLLLIGAGSGITPLMSMIRWLKDRESMIDTILYYSVRSEKDTIFRAELDELNNTFLGFKYQMVATSVRQEKHSTVLSGRISDFLLKSVAPDFKFRDCYTCGPTGFMGSVKSILKTSGYDMQRFNMESFGIRKNMMVSKGSGPDHNFKIQFLNQRQSINTDGSTSLLEVAESAGIQINFSCRSGNCGKCKIRILNGLVYQASKYGLNKNEISAGYILACASFPESHCVIS